VTSDAIERLKYHRQCAWLENLMPHFGNPCRRSDHGSDGRCELATVPPPGKFVEAAMEDSFDSYLEAYFAAYFAGFGGTLPPPGLYERMLEMVEPPLLRASLAATGGNQIKAAELLGINRNTLRTKIRQRGIKIARGLT
jgi:DNA-binding protein Fis